MGKSAPKLDLFPHPDTGNPGLEQPPLPQGQNLPLNYKSLWRNRADHKPSVGSSLPRQGSKEGLAPCAQFFSLYLPGK